MILKEDKTNWKYILIIVVLATIVGGGILWNLSSVEISLIPIVIVKPSQSRELEEGRIVFDIYYATTDRPSWYEGTKTWVNMVTIPRLIGYKDKEAQTAFNDFSQKYLVDLSGHDQLRSGISIEYLQELADLLLDKYEISIQYLPEPRFLFKNGLVSIVFNFWAIGGAHPVQGRIVLNYDLESNREITLNDVLVANEEEVRFLIEKKLLEEIKNMDPDELPPAFSPDKVPCSGMELGISGFYFTDTELAIMIVGHRLNQYFCWPDREFLFAFDELNGIVRRDGPIPRLRQ